VSSAKGPVYRVEDDQNYVFDANVNESSYVGYVETDLFRAGTMQYCIDNFVPLLRHYLDF
jgi:hypothetical protein